MTSCYCDHDGPEFYHKETPTAKKEHKCCECGSTIKVGEQYERVRGKWEGDISTFKTCADCIEVRDALSDMPCFCWSHGGLSEDVSNQFAYASFTPGERFAYLRVIAAHRKRKRLTT